MRSKDLLNRDIAILMVKFRGRIEENGLENVKPEVLGEEEIEKYSTTLESGFILCNQNISILSPWKWTLTLPRPLMN